MMRIHRRIDETVEDPETAEALKPWYMIMCKRPCFHNDYLPTFNRPNVHLVDTHGEGITKIGRTGPIFDGSEYELDVLIYATGFEVQKTGIYNRIVGEGGVDLDEKYADGIRTLLGIHTHGFPNLFIMGGYQASFQFNLTDLLQVQGDHIATCIDLRPRATATTRSTATPDSRGVVGAGGHRQPRQDQPQPGVHARLLQLRGPENRRQDGNYNGGFPAYIDHIAAVEADDGGSLRLHPRLTAPVQRRSARRAGVAEATGYHARRRRRAAPYRAEYLASAAASPTSTSRPPAGSRSSTLGLPWMCPSVSIATRLQPVC